MPNSLNLIESLAQDRHAERYHGSREAQDGASTTRRTDAEGRTLETTKRRAGWLLVGLGLRLVAGGDDSAAARRTRLIAK